ncbi:hypothetical protein METBIDRAFT_43406 [Metschnikowia bicuspidata var. bicuspidata NRRL YB-4993]|uniref:Transcription regulator LGE1 helical region domain-containing protein n=1 Tax=Metschnikowia bicuspidata var. bicuspidata NRRL YB-4993 TaxID=869754 RepID=A0A1A0H921_9ASCO|nr:hypothetical protein METBIDRAFT_43406 [Metschnikowia bicuspidata var. bicuspidata NRRL YB-4993]OBA20500.1 hypothetical protein METBIDRAFT_43406 [Metschnikowia bicuspidata var. bicuspidata NRRL YB-4993]
MSGNGGYYPNGESRGTGRYDSYYDKNTDSRDSRGRGGYRGGRGHGRYGANLRGRGKGFGRPDHSYGGRPLYRDANHRGGDSPRDDPRDHGPRDFAPREHPYHRDGPRDLRRDDQREILRPDSYSGRRENDDLRTGEAREHARNRDSSPGRTNGHPQLEDRGHDRADRSTERPAERLTERPQYSGMRGPSRGSNYGQKRTSDAGHGSHRTNPWITLLKLGQGKTAARVELNYKEISRVNDRLAELQSEKVKLACALSTLEVYAKRDALNVEICSEKLDEFTYL